MLDALPSIPTLTAGNDGIDSSNDRHIGNPDRRSSDIIYTFAEQFGDSRAGVEKFISKRYTAAFGATLTNFMPRLFSLHSAKGDMVAALGLRPASQRLFLERYLDHPIEAVLGNALGMPVERRQIVEVGHFAGAGVGASRAMIKQMTAALFHEGFRWVAFTGTIGLRNAFYRLGLNPMDLAPADPMRLDHNERLQWGRYYQEMPRVQFGDITDGFAALRHPNPHPHRPPTANPSVRKTPQ
ncbi:MAG TPA: thermostable hemolysin [Herbaspirillum sp.]|jgi:hypothetical protein|nr:thermostable hemolysin [Herbaspirillum sp.]